MIDIIILLAKAYVYIRTYLIFVMHACDRHHHPPRQNICIEEYICSYVQISYLYFGNVGFVMLVSAVCMTSRLERGLQPYDPDCRGDRTENTNNNDYPDT